MDTTTEDACIPWDPISPEQNVWFDVTVVAFEQSVRGGYGNITVVLFHSAVNGGDLGTPDSDTWRIEFAGTIGFRRHLIASWKDAEPFPRPAERTKTFWEDAPSSLVRRSVEPNHPYAIRHFVIASEYDAFEILARTWKTTHLTLGDGRRLLEST
jgi:hypothetical protein